MSIRILHVMDTLGQGGLENGVANVIGGLDPAAFEHIVFTMRGYGPTAERLPGRVRLATIPEERRNSRFQAREVARAIREFQPDVVHSRNWGTIETVIAARWTGRRVIHSEHGLEMSDTADEPRRRVWFRRFAYELADGVVTVSHHLKELFARRTGFRRERFTVIPNGVDTDRFRPDSASRESARRDLQLGEREFCVGCVGNLLPVKDHLTVLKALDLLGWTEPNWRLIIVGSGPERSTLEAFLAARPALRARVFLAGSSKRVPELLNAMDAYVLSSAAEGMSNSLLEAMATGLPVVATRVGGNPEVIGPDAGLLFEAGDAAALAGHLAELAANPGTRERLGALAGRRVREQFSIARMVARYGELYRTTSGAAVSVRAVAGA